MADRGEYRSFYVSFWDDPDVHALSDRAYRVLSTLKGTLPPSGIGVVYAAQLAERCRATPKQIEAALVELEMPKPGQRLGWIVRERNIIWIVNALRYEPNLYVTNEKHRTFVAKQLLPLGDRLPIVNQFRRYYADWGLIAASESEDNQEGNEGASDTPANNPDTVSDRVSKHIDVDVEGSVNGDRSKTAASSSARASSLEVVTGTARQELDRLLSHVPVRESWLAEMDAALAGMHGFTLTPEQLGQAIHDFVGNGAASNPSLRHFRSYLRSAGLPVKSAEKSPDRAKPRGGVTNRTYANVRAAIEDLP